MNAVVPFQANNFPTLYGNMRYAISECHSVDECKDIGDKAVALSTYCKQINDYESVRKFNEVRLRSLRRVGQLIAELKLADEGVLTTYQLNAAKVFAEVSEPAFETTIKATDFGLKRTVESLVSAQADAAAKVRAAAEAQRLADMTPAERLAHEEKRRLRSERSDKRWEARNPWHSDYVYKQEIKERIDAAHAAAEVEIGVTLKRNDRKKMHEIVFLIERDIAEAIRQAAHEHRISQQEVLRQGLQMWFKANGYDVSVPSTANKVS